MITSYSFSDKAVLMMLEQTKPGITNRFDVLESNLPRPVFNQISVSLIILFCLISVVLVFSRKTINNRNLLLAVAIPCVLVFAYPVISRDIFSYLYYAKMVIIYHQNPYQIAPLANYSSDLWLGFVHNVERVYAYGPIALIINLAPMAVLGAEKLIVNVFVYKFICLAFFLLGAWLFWKITKNRNLTLVFWVLNPYILNELLINGHNDLMMIVFFWMAIFLKQEAKPLLSALAYSLSVGTKFLTAPLLPILFLPKKIQTVLALSSIIVLASYLIANGNLPWYYSWMYFCLPFLKLNKGQILAVLLLQLSLTLGYSGFLETGKWGALPSSELSLAIVKSAKLFLPLFVSATLYPIFQKNRCSK